MRSVFVVAALALAVAACGDNLSPNVPDAAPIDGPPLVDAPPATNFTQFVHQQILCTTCDTADPVAYPVFGSLPDNDLDNADAYADLFQ